MDTPHVYSGIPVSGGVVLGPLWVLPEKEEIYRLRGFPVEEKAQFAQALVNAAKEIQEIIDRADTLAGEIMEFQLALLDDEDLLNPVLEQIAAGSPAHESWSKQLDQEILNYQNMEDAYFSERANDLADLKQRVLNQFLESRESVAGPQDAILIAHSLTPSEFLEINWQHYVGAATCEGSPTSHVAILARARGINLIVGLEANLTELDGVAMAILDAEQGCLICQPDAASLTQAHHRIAVLTQANQETQAILTEPAKTANDQLVKVMINVDDPSLLSSLSPETCDGIGLTRTEFLFKQGSFPTEKEQLAVYRKILKWADGKPVTIRTLDAGGDKPMPGITFDGESNPFLGMRGIRLSLLHEDFFLQQLRALCRAATIGPLRVMIPMVTQPDEMRQVRQLFKKVVDQLHEAGIPHQLPEIGMMVEVPSAAMLAGQFEVDFYSIGSNDLIQYTTASARDIPGVAHLADPRNPAVLELIRMTLAAGHERKVDVSLCGDMASSPDLTPLLLECGLRGFSCAPAQIGPVKLAISRWPFITPDNRPM